VKRALAKAWRRLRRLRRLFGRGEIGFRLLKLRPERADPTAPGLLLIQIDGLGGDQFDAALRAGNLPFLQRLLARERYQRLDLYAGVPCTTPAVQAELFYGQKATVPAFSFRHPDSGAVVRMFSPEAARALEDDLALRHEPLLRGGAAYGNIFSGGASDDEAHFCVSALGWGPVLRTVRPLAIVGLLLSNLTSVVRVLALLVLEFFIAIYDFVRGINSHAHFLHEIRFVLARVSICIGLRELIAIGASIDIARGLPIVHVNFAGYDEQAHRRGPDAAFAHWALKGIDRTIARLWKSAMRAESRDYRVWIYSDHGQERVLSYPRLHGRSLEDAVAAIVDGAPAVGAAVPHSVAAFHPSYRLRTLRNAGLPFNSLHPDATRAPRPETVIVAAMGPVGYVYLKTSPSFEDKRALALRLVTEAAVPAVLASMEGDCVHAWTADGEWLLPRDGEQVLGADHPFAFDAVEDLVNMVRHPGAGDLTLAGWRAGHAPVSFAIENGAHGGFGPHETRGIVLLEAEARLPVRTYPHLRARDLRSAALALLGRHAIDAAARVANHNFETRALRVMTYNVHGCTGMDGRTLPHRCARVIAQSAPEIVALQELDVGRSRSGGVDQAHRIAEILAMEHLFHAALEVREEQYGNAVLSALPMRMVKTDALPRVGRSEPRGALWVAIEIDDTEVQVINTHLGLGPAERHKQIEFLISDQWLGSACKCGPVILCGDLNAGERSHVCRQLRLRLRDAQLHHAAARPLNTWFGAYPTRRLDHIFVSREIEVESFEVPRSHLARLTSDHLPLVVNMKVPLNWDSGFARPGEMA